ncbi:MAG: chemotaxis protein [Parvibaculum sp.]|nr:chemotaxis protein [Parvibaculum sp.]|tara:strand:- start:14659 stop:15174 length:516 start_codon:yes stop_codon:yes gene_type:complete
MSSNDENTARIKKLTQECVDIVRTILVARREMGRLHDPELREVHLPRASEEIGAILAMTEAATNDIMLAAEDMMALDMSDPDYAAEQVNGACMRIFEACSFQDITGQRIANVLKTLQLVESKIGQLENAWAGASAVEPEVAAPAATDSALLNGPALEGEGIEQDFVDQLFA